MSKKEIKPALKGWLKEAQEEARQTVKNEPEISCRLCDEEATCFGQYEGHGPIQSHCTTHCGHGNEDGWCRSIESLGL